MTKNKIIFWTNTGLLALFMASGAIPDILMFELAKKVFAHLGYPIYLLPFIGIAKIFGSITILIPKFSKLKEWAYAGLSFDLFGAIYSNIQVDGFGVNILFPLFGILLLTVSYIFLVKVKANNVKV